MDGFQHAGAHCGEGDRGGGGVRGGEGAEGVADCGEECGDAWEGGWGEGAGQGGEEGGVILLAVLGVVHLRGREWGCGFDLKFGVDGGV